MPLAKPVWNTGKCNRDCLPMLKCPPGSHVSKSHRSCVWHGRDNAQPKAETQSFLSSLFSPSPSTAPQGQLFDRPAAVPDTSFNDYMASRSGSEEFGGGGRRRSRYRSSRRRRSHKKSRKRKSHKKSRKRKSHKKSGKSHKKSRRRSRH